MFYADSSFLVALYIDRDTHTLRAKAIMRRQMEELAFTPLQRLKLRNTIRLYELNEQTTTEETRHAFRKIEDDLRDGFLVHVPAAFVEVCRAADRISDSLPGCRTLDLIHVATARVIGTDTFLSFDRRQRDVAKSVGFDVLPKRV